MLDALELCIRDIYWHICHTNAVYIIKSTRFVYLINIFQLHEESRVKLLCKILLWKRYRSGSDVGFDYNGI